MIAKSDGRGRSVRLSASENQMVVDGIKHFALNGMALDKTSAMGMVKTLLSRFSVERQQITGFKASQPGCRWMNLL